MSPARSPTGPHPRRAARSPYSKQFNVHGHRPGMIILVKSGLVIGAQSALASDDLPANPSPLETLMHIERIHTTEAFAALAAEWNALLARSASRVPFLRHEYLLTWWRTLGGGEWPHGDLYILTGRDAQGRLRGIAPCFQTENRAGQPVLMLLGSIEVSDYLDFIAAPEDLTDFVRAVCAFLAATPDIRTVDLYNLPEDSPTLPLLQSQAPTLGWQVRQERLQPAPQVLLPDSWEAYLAGLSKKQRHEIRRKMRRIANGNQVRWYIVEEEATLDAEIEAFLQLMAYDPVKEAFLTAAMRRQMRDAIHTAFRAGWLQLAFLEVNGEKAAAYLNFDYDNRIWVYNSGLNGAFRALSPGWVLLAHLIRWAIAHGRSVYDFMRGDEDYKYRFGGVDRWVWRVTLQR